jgi:carbamoylphosphate synthase large subunit
MACLAIIGVPRTAHTLTQAVVQARLRGLDVALVDKPAQIERCPADLPVSRRIAIDRLEADAAAEALEPLNPDFVLSFSEFTLLLAADVRERLGLHGSSAAAVRLSRHKHETRRRLQACGLTQVDFEVATLPELDEAALRFDPPFVIKPVSLTGSIGVHAVRSREEVASFKARLVQPEAEAASGSLFIIEEFIRGDEYSVEGIYDGARFHLIAVTQKRTNGFPNFAETGHTLPAPALPDLDFRLFVEAVAAALGLDTTPIHAEVKVHESRLELVEIHARFGGDYIPLLIEMALGYNLFGAYYDLLLGGGVPPPEAPRAVAGIEFLHEEELVFWPSFPRRYPGVTYCVRVDAAGEPAEAELSNIRILNRRIGHVVFSASDHDAADAFVSSLGSVTSIAGSGCGCSSTGRAS